MVPLYNASRKTHAVVQPRRMRGPNMCTFSEPKNVSIFGSDWHRFLNRKLRLGLRVSTGEKRAKEKKIEQHQTVMGASEAIKKKHMLFALTPPPGDGFERTKDCCWNAL